MNSLHDALDDSLGCYRIRTVYRDVMSQITIKHIILLAIALLTVAISMTAAVTMMAAMRLLVNRMGIRRWCVWLLLGQQAGEPIPILGIVMEVSAL